MMRIIAPILFFVLAAATKGTFVKKKKSYNNNKEIRPPPTFLSSANAVAATVGVAAQFTKKIRRKKIAWEGDIPIYKHIDRHRDTR